MRRPNQSLPGWLAALGATIGAAAALLGVAEVSAQPARLGIAAAVSASAGTAATRPKAQKKVPSGPAHGLAALFNNAMVPLEWMPPGTNASPVPSEEVFPPQTLTIRFNHSLHTKTAELSCAECHSSAASSTKASDRLMPDPTDSCDNCHDVDHSELANVEWGGEEDNGRCTFCHLGDDAGKNGQVAAMVIPPPNLVMNHKAHLDRNIQCAQCHGMIGELEQAGRQQLPRMAGCFVCHAQSGAARGQAKGACSTCHPSRPNGTLETSFPTGSLKPPMWLHNAAHTPDWIDRHKRIAGADSQLCASCHVSKFCTDCHDGAVRPRAIHPNDWLSMHPQAARQDSPRCVSCHQLQTFCGDCHRRVGVARDAPSSRRMAGRRFHPPPQIWTQAPRSSSHHAWEAQRNLNACVSCHTERDCATCHATKGLRGGAGVSPHPIGFSDKCASAQRRNPRPCLVCHSSSDSALASCR